MMGKHLRRRFSLQPSFMKDDNADDKPKRDKFDRHDIDTAIIESAAKREEPYRIVVLGPEKVGKTALICRFLDKSFPIKHKPTTEQTNHGTFTLAGVKIKLEILDTSGKNEFPAMRTLALQRGDAFILVYDITKSETFEEMRRIRDEIHAVRQSNNVPIVVVGNKIDLAKTESESESEEKREVDYYTTESIVSVDWENGFVEASAKENENVNQIFKELLLQAKLAYKLSPSHLRKNFFSHRRQSLPPNQGGSGSSTHGQPGSCPPSTVHVPSPLQLQHLQQIQARGSRGKRNSCILS